jgi:hypothetical protein
MWLSVATQGTFGRGEVRGARPRLHKCDSEQAGAQHYKASSNQLEETVGYEIIVTHGTPPAPDAGPNLLKISESAFVAVWVHPDEER